MSEVITFTAPVDAPKTVFRIALLSFDWLNAMIKVHLREYAGGVFGDRVIVVNYTGPDALALMTSLNKINLTTQSLHQRVIAKLIADGKLPAGAASGTPD